MLQTNPTCVDLILTNILQRFSNTCVVETGLSDFHVMAMATMRNYFEEVSVQYHQL